MKLRFGLVLSLVGAVSVPVVLGWPSPASAVGKIDDGDKRCFAVAGSPGDVALVNLTPVEAEGLGNGQLVSSDVNNTPLASNVNFGANTFDPNVAAAPIGADGQVCYLNSNNTRTHLVADHLGTLDADIYQPATNSGVAKRLVDTRPGSSKIQAGGRLCFAVAGSPGDVALVNLTPVEAEGLGNGQLVSSDVKNTPLASNVNFGANTFDPNVAAAPIGADGQVCYLNSNNTRTHLVADHLGTLDADIYQPATNSGVAKRLVDTRPGSSKIQAGGRLCFAVAGSPGDVALVNLTPVEAEGLGNGQLVSSDVKNTPLASNVNFGANTFDPNVAAAPIGADGQVCYLNSNNTRTHLVADHLGTLDADIYQPATNSGVAKRLVDTRTEAPPPTTTTTPPATTTTTTVPPSCDPSYPTVCIPPPPPDLNCGDITHRNFVVLQPDPHNFDGNNDGIGCVG
ncbi:MAG: hypothetical protein R8G01_05550 [Ilumatobacteraceae bacterium]|nr:hypothetical protein [Ilumatobacteraceae bacterium]